MSILDAAWLYGTPESTYGTAVALARGYEAQSDGFKRKQSYLESVGMRSGLQAVRSDRRTAINMGATGSIDVDFLAKGMGLLVRDIFGAGTGPTLVSGITFDQVHQTTKDGPSASATAQLIRPFVDGSTQQFTYTGVVCTGWELTGEVDKFLKLHVDYDARNEDTTTAAGTPVYPAAPNPPFDWTMLAATVGGTPIDASKLSLKADYQMNTDRRFMKSGASNAQKKQPRVGGLPQYTGALEAEFGSTAEYARFTAGTVLVAQFIWTGGLIEAGKNFTLTIDLPAIQYIGETPEASMSDLPKQSLPFAVLHDGTNPAVKFTIRSSDSAL